MHYDAFDDLMVLSNDLTEAPGLTLCGLVRNEMYFLPVFLDHYRRLGVERFILMDDRSDDGTREYLAGQADVMVLGSGRRFGDTVVADTGPMAGRPAAMYVVWKALMMRRFCTDRWALCLDADEFIVLPPGEQLADVITRAEAGPGRAVTGIMLDTYPANVTDLKTARPFDAAADWYVDGEPHAAWHPETSDFRMRHPGMRARLMYRFGLTRAGWRQRVKRLLKGGSRYPSFNEITKIVLMSWEEDAVFLNSHRTTQAVNPKLLLPILHFKFTPDLYRRVMEAIADNQHYKGAVEYHQLHDLLTRMEAAGGSFLYDKSHKARDFEALRRSGNALLP